MNENLSKNVNETVNFECCSIIDDEIMFGNMSENVNENVNLSESVNENMK